MDRVVIGTIDQNMVKRDQNLDVAEMTRDLVRLFRGGLMPILLRNMSGSGTESKSTRVLVDQGYS